MIKTPGSLELGTSSYRTRAWENIVAAKINRRHGYLRSELLQPCGFFCSSKEDNTIMMQHFTLEIDPSA